MPVDFIGFVNGRNHSEIIPAEGPVVNLDHVEAAAKIHENGGFDRVLVAFHSNSPESILISQHVANVTRRLGLMVAHRPGFTAPTLAARQFATLDAISGGRASVHIITGGDDRELQADGDHLTKAERYARTSEYLDIVRREWSSDAPFDYDGKYYKVRGAHSAIRPQNGSSIPVFFGGSSEEAIAVAGKHADIYALWGETYDQVRETIARVKASAAQHGRTVRFSLSLRPILAETEEAAWAKAEHILETARGLQEQTGYARPSVVPNEGSRRLLAAAAQGARLDKRLWTGLAALTGARGNSTSLVGTAEQVADALLDYYRLGVTNILIRGFDPLQDAYVYGRDLIPLARRLIAAEDARSGAGREAA
ncbi:alkanesulfonate monooxygenase [Acetobacter nitrogenifigens DSM 23921 = NBRC 105050]|uniref:Alkanesulfonate monooxygenase n=1 Tax=Acetobacter nitrogenifigens DSM 23921 = NBRC 105050 TaxID=1120919 RepID=A0A511X7B5_9PROT|nr:LLM class flavin-dependent oxidoreductase [Acetobacter nitrogenifigens]GBQ95507.1 alkanesulfonate monooxygenase [Acetobacter nitrogenifigens DSM 23921 = NBRC 105050]GEN58847.1 alkanesulfonate monooxygenase [Acetobacter nitrogenifigens DSM 23921 = NBRC 105050]